jgi:hypothetical protein
MRLEKIGRLELTYTEIDTEFPFGEGGQVYGILTGKLEAGDLRGTLHTTNLARQRPDGDFTPALRGIFSTAQGVPMFFTMDGISIKDKNASPPRRIVTTGITLWSSDPSLSAWNAEYLLAELQGGPVGDSWGVAGSVYRCVPEI